MSNLNRKTTSNKTKHVLIENELKKLKAFISSYFIDKSHFEKDGTQNYLVFQQITRYFKILPNTNYILSWKSKDYPLKLQNHILHHHLLHLIIILYQH